MAGDADKAELIAQIAAARAQMAETGRALEQAGEALKHKLDVPARARASYQKNKVAWLTGAALAGFLLSRLPARQKTVYVERSTGQALGTAGKLGKLGMLWGALKFATSFAKPFLADMVGQRVQDLAQRFAGQAASEEPQKNQPPRTNG